MLTNSQWQLSSDHAEKADFGIGEITTREQERFVRTEIKIVLGKNGGYMPSSLGVRLISVGRQAGSETKIFAIRQLQFSEF